jgi:oligopeptide/dipeptide ABC transporter ATP-binding protein
VADARPLLVIEDLVVQYAKRGRRGRDGHDGRGAVAPAVDSVSIDIRPGQTVGLVGESGSGKTTIGRAILGLAPVTSGKITFDGADITHVSSKARRALSNDIQIVFQDPFGSMNPTHTVGQILSEPLRNGVSRFQGDARTRVKEILERVGLPHNSSERYPGQFSGGQRQRIAIARALMLSPRLVVCDEPVSALDLSVQAQILNLFRELQQDLGVAYLFIAHDLDVVRHLSDRIVVLYRGQVMETGTAHDVHRTPRHPYSRALSDAAPVPDQSLQTQRRAARLAIVASGTAVVDRVAGEAGCVFASRCPLVVDMCTAQRPQLISPIGATSLVACARRNENI